MSVWVALFKPIPRASRTVSPTHIIQHIIRLARADSFLATHTRQPQSWPAYLACCCFRLAFACSCSIPPPLCRAVLSPIPATTAPASSLSLLSSHVCSMLFPSGGQSTRSHYSLTVVIAKSAGRTLKHQYCTGSRHEMAFPRSTQLAVNTFASFAGFPI